MYRHLYLLLLLIFVAACSDQPRQIEFSGETMGTTYQVVVVTEKTDLDRQQLLAAVEATLGNVNAKYSNWDPSSEVSVFNAMKALDFVEISDGFQLMLDIADDAHQATNGSFDLTLTPVINLWGFGPSGKITRSPSASQIAEAKAIVGQDRVIDRSEDGSLLRKTHPEATIYLTALAKGYGIDAVAETLKSLGATDFMVEIGGDIYVSGQTSRQSDWLIGIERPDVGQKNVQEIIELTNAGMATSGDYRNYFEENGVRYSHIIDAMTGKPISHRTASVTVIANTATEADAWATALLAVGADDGLTIANSLGLDALFIAREDSDDGIQFELIATNGFETYLSRLKE